MITTEPTIEEWIDMLCPELALMPNVDMFIFMAQKVLSASVFGADYNYAVALRASHDFEIAKRDPSETGLLTSKTEGKLSMSFWNSVKPTNSTLSQTMYGRKLIELISTKGLKFSVGNPDATL